MHRRWSWVVALVVALALGACGGSSGKAKAKVKPAPSTTTTTWSPAQRTQAAAWCHDVQRVYQEHQAKSTATVPDTIALAQRYVPLAGANAAQFRGVAANLAKVSRASGAIAAGLVLTEWQAQCKQMHLL